MEKAVPCLSPEEAAVLADLESHGLNVLQLRDVLRGAHVFIDEPAQYERDPGDPARFAAQGIGNDELRQLLEHLAARQLEPPRR